MKDLRAETYESNFDDEILYESESDDENVTGLTRRTEPFGPVKKHDENLPIAKPYKGKAVYKVCEGYVRREACHIPSLYLEAMERVFRDPRFEQLRFSERNRNRIMRIAMAPDKRRNVGNFLSMSPICDSGVLRVMMSRVIQGPYSHPGQDPINWGISGPIGDMRSLFDDLEAMYVELTGNLKSSERRALKRLEKRAEVEMVSLNRVPEDLEPGAGISGRFAPPPAREEEPLWDVKSYGRTPFASSLPAIPLNDDVASNPYGSLYSLTQPGSCDYALRRSVIREEITNSPHGFRCDLTIDRRDYPSKLVCYGEARNSIKSARFECAQALLRSAELVIFVRPFHFCVSPGYYDYVNDVTAVNTHIVYSSLNGAAGEVTNENCHDEWSSASEKIESWRAKLPMFDTFCTGPKGMAMCFRSPVTLPDGTTVAPKCPLPTGIQVVTLAKSFFGIELGFEVIPGDLTLEPTPARLSCDFCDWPVWTDVEVYAVWDTYPGAPGHNLYVLSVVLELPNISAFEYELTDIEDVPTMLRLNGGGPKSAMKKLVMSMDDIKKENQRSNSRSGTPTRKRPVIPKNLQKVIKKTLVSSGRGLGGAAGGMVGLSGAGKAVGGQLAKKFSRLIGSGDYSAPTGVTGGESAINSVIHGKPSSTASFGPGDMTLAHREYCFDLLSQTPGAISFTTINWNPNSAFCPWLSKLSTSYERVEVHGLVIETVSLTAPFSTAGNLGSYGFTSEQNVSAPTFTSKSQFENSSNAISARLDQNIMYGVECKGLPFTTYYVAGPNTTNTPSNLVYPFNIQYFLSPSASVASGTAVAELWQSYNLTFRNPIVQGSTTATGGSYSECSLQYQIVPAGTYSISSARVDSAVSAQVPINTPTLVDITAPGTSLELATVNSWSGSTLPVGLYFFEQIMTISSSLNVPTAMNSQVCTNLATQSRYVGGQQIDVLSTTNSWVGVADTVTPGAGNYEYRFRGVLQVVGSNPTLRINYCYNLAATTALTIRCETSLMALPAGYNRFS